MYIALNGNEIVNHNKMTNHNKTAVVLMSGGMDSALCAAIAKRDGYRIAALHLSYAQRTESKERECFEKLADHFGVVKKLIVDIDYLSKIGGSSLTDNNIEVARADLQNSGIPSSYVPFRNANMLAIATSWAEAIGAPAIYIGAIQEDSSGYPDTRKVFIDAFQLAVTAGTKPETNIIIYTPIIDLAKSEIVTMGLGLGVPFGLTWSCYKSCEPACGQCDSCMLRLRGFAAAGIEDPIRYR